MKKKSGRKKETLKTVAQVVEYEALLTNSQEWLRIFGRAPRGRRAIPPKDRILRDLARRQFENRSDLRELRDQLRVVQTEAEAAVLTRPPDFRPLIRGVETFGPYMFAPRGRVTTLLWWWIERWVKALHGDQTAREECTAIAESLGRWTQGRKPLPVNAVPSRERQRQEESAQKLTKEVREQAARNRQHGRSPTRAVEEAKRAILEEWGKKSRAKKKEAILARVEELLHSELSEK